MSRIFKQPVIANQGVGILAKRDYDYVSMLCVEEWFHPKAIAADYILGTTAMPTAAAGADVTTFAHQPDFPRNVTAIADAAQTAHIIVSGLNQFGAAITEELTLNGTTSVAGTKAFASITSIHLNQRSGAASITVGIGNVLGCARQVRLFLPEGLVDEVLESTLPTLNATNNTIVFNTALADTKTYIAKYWSKDVK